MSAHSPACVRFSIALVLLAAAATADAQPVALECAQSAQTLDGPVGTTFTVTCPASCDPAVVWGTGVYSDDSSICTAARHAGEISPAGGTATLTIASGQEAYSGSTENGVTTADWGAWNRSFVFGRTTAPDCYANAQGLAGEAGTTWTVSCPAGCSSGGIVWGTGTYSDDSAVCPAAIHAGVLTDAGGQATLRILPGQQEYPSSTLNGVSTSSWGEWSRSFTFELESRSTNVNSVTGQCLALASATLIVRHSSSAEASKSWASQWRHRGYRINIDRMAKFRSTVIPPMNQLATSSTSVPSPMTASMEIV